MSQSGSCLCGDVAFTAEAMPSMQACHCSMCRKWGGGPFMAAPCKNATFDGPVKSFASSDHGDRGFCENCGTHLFFFAKAANIHAIPIGLFDDPAGIPFRAEIYIDSKPDYYEFGGDRKKMTGAEFEKQFS